MVQSSSLHTGTQQTLSRASVCRLHCQCHTVGPPIRLYAVEAFSNFSDCIFVAASSASQLS